MAEEKKKDLIEVIIETPKGSQNKYKYDEKRKIYKLHKILPTGFAFPYDFGLIPETKGEDGDPLDILVITQQTTFPGCHIDCRILGGLKATQTEKNGELIRNDRFIGVPDCDRLYDDVQEMSDLPDEMIEQITHFFFSYRKYDGGDFNTEGLLSAETVKKLIKNHS